MFIRDSPLILYAFLGTSRQLSVGPVAMISLLISSGIGHLAIAGSDQYIAMAILLALMVGIIQFSMGIFKLGFLVNFLSHPVIAGFTSAAAIIIAISQFKHLLGIKVSGEKFLDIITQIFQNIVCLLYTSDAADERSSVDLGGRRIIKKKNKMNIGDVTCD